MVNENKEYIMDEMRDPGEITCQDVADWINKKYGDVWDEYITSSDLWDEYMTSSDMLFVDVVKCPRCYCYFGSNEGIFLTIESMDDSMDDTVAVFAKTLDESDVKWYECVHTIAGIGLELKKIWG